jgi:hypothetical protein
MALGRVHDFMVGSVEPVMAAPKVPLPTASGRTQAPGEQGAIVAQLATQTGLSTAEVACLLAGAE